jgi:hypothetical protein
VEGALSFTTFFEVSDVKSSDLSSRDGLTPGHVTAQKTKRGAAECFSESMQGPLSPRDNGNVMLLVNGNPHNGMGLCIKCNKVHLYIVCT